MKQQYPQLNNTLYYFSTNTIHYFELIIDVYPNDFLSKNTLKPGPSGFETLCEASVKTCMSKKPVHVAFLAIYIYLAWVV